MRRPLATITAICLLAALSTLAPTTATAAETAPKYVSARGLLAKLTVHVEDHTHKYDRDRFGYDHPLDADHDGCITRKEVLIRDAISIDHVSASCAVYGQWKSPYDNKVTDNPNTLQIDHLVPLAEAWHSGAYKWSHRRQIAFGNDLGYKWDLQAVTSALNQSKSDGDPAEWLPPKNTCTYVKAWIGVKYRWDLPIDTAEKKALTTQLNKCSSVTVLRPGKPDIAALVGS